MVRNSIPVLLLSIAFTFLFQGTIYSQTGVIPTGSDTACLTGISLYKRAYGGNKDELIYNSAVTADSGYVLVGQTNSFGNGGVDGLVMKVNKRGNVVWTKALGGTGYDWLVQVRRTSDNGFIACGQTKSYGNPGGDAWLVKLDAAGNVQWSKKYGDGNVNGEISYDVIQLTDGGYAFCGVHRFAGGVAESFVVRTNSQGDVIWSKQYGNGSSDDAGGLVEDGNSLVVVGFYLASSFYDGYIMKLDKTNGTVQWIRGYDAEGRSTWFNKVERTSTGYQVFSVITDNFVDQNQQVCIWNLNTDGTLQNVRKLSIPGVWSISYGWNAQADGGFVASSGENTSGSDVILCRVNASGSLVWSKKYLQTGRQEITSIQRNAEGVYAAIGHNNNVGTTIDSSNAYIIRIDSTGMGGPCSGVNTSELTVFTPSNVATTPDVIPLGDVAINNPVISVGSVSFVPVTNTACFYCHIPIPVLPPDTTCANGIPLYQKLYSGASADLAEWLTATADSGYVIAGQTNSFGSGLYDGFLTKVSKKGNLVWSRSVGGTGNDVLYGVRATNDNGFIAVGITKSYGNAAGDAWLVKTDASGNIQWSKKYGNGNIDGEAAFEVVQLSDGGYAFCGAHQFAAGVTESFVVRTDNLGNVIWSKQFGHAGSDEAWGLMEDGNSLVVVGFYRAPNLYDGYVMKLDKSNGAVQWKRTYDAESNRHLLMAKIKPTSSGYQVLSFLMDDFNGTNLQQCIWNLAADGAVQSVRKIAVPGVQTSGYGWMPQANGGFVVANGENNNNADIIFTQVSSSGSIGWSSKHSYPGRQWIRAMIASPGGGYAAVGISNNAGTFADSSNVYLIRIDSSGNGGACSGVSTTDATVVTPSFTTSPISTPSLADVTINNPVISAGSASFVPATNTLCFYCQPKPTGTARPVTAGRENERLHTIKAYPNPVINGSVNLQVDAIYNDMALINIVDVNGTVMYSLAPREIIEGKNIIRINLPLQLQHYANYFISVQFRNYKSAVKIFVIR